MSIRPVFDGHNDALLRMYMKKDGDPIAGFISGDAGHIDLPKARAGGFAGGMFAAFVPPISEKGSAAPDSDLPLSMPPEMEMNHARAVTIAQIALLLKLEAGSGGAVRVARSAADIRTTNAAGGIAAVMHIEGIEAVDAELDFLHVLHAAGLRSLGPVWSRNNVFAHGVPFKFPGSPDFGPGLTDAGRHLVKTCNTLGILIDLSHLNEAGFWDVAKLSTAPLVATHSNAHALCPAPRNLTDDQFKAIAESKGVVGLNFGTGFLREDGRMTADAPLDRMVDHLSYMVDIMGEDCVALGSDFDGITPPKEIGDASGLPRLMAAMTARGFNEALINKIAYDNWLSLLERTIG